MRDRTPEEAKFFWNGGPIEVAERTGGAYFRAEDAGALEAIYQLLVLRGGILLSGGVRHVGEGGEVRDVEPGIADGLDVQRLRPVVDGLREAVHGVALDELDVHPEAGEGDLELVVGAPVEIAGGDDVVPGGGDVADGQELRRLPRPVRPRGLRLVEGADISFERHTGVIYRKRGTLPAAAAALASVAAPADKLIYVFGGYTVNEDGSEVSTPWTHEFDPRKRVFEERSPMPVPVDDAVAVTFDDRYIYLVSGWHDLGNVNLVQRYDTVEDAWVQATPIPGPAVFGHAGGIVGNTIVYCDGVAVEAHSDRPRDFAAVPDCFLGIIDDEDGRRIDWRSVDYHPGLPRYRMAAAGIPEVNGVLFVGGSENPYNYDGIGYDGQPSEPARGALLFDIDTQSWQELELEGPRQSPIAH